MAYSDSEGEDEPFRLTRKKKKKTDDSDQNAETEEEKDVEPSGVVAQLPQAIQQTPKLLKAARRAINLCSLQYEPQISFFETINAELFLRTSKVLPSFEALPLVFGNCYMSFLKEVTQVTVILPADFQKMSMSFYRVSADSHGHSPTSESFMTD